MMNFRAMTGASSIFTPDDISSLRAWYDASDITTITKDGSNFVSSWNDKTINNYDLTASGSARPTWSDNQLNKRAVLDFNGTSNTFALPSGLYGLSNGANTIFAVCKADIDTSLQVVFGLFEAGSARTDIRYTGTSGNISFQSRTASGGGVTKTSVSTTSYGVLMGRRSGTTQAIAFNNSAEITNNSGADENGINAGHIGSFLGTSFWLDGQIAEILVFNSSLSSGDITKVNNYLSKKWAIGIE